MDTVLLLKAAIMGLIEGFTEFLPISSTGHLILAESLLHFDAASAGVFKIAIQTGAILAVLWEYKTRFLSTLRGIRDQATAQRFASNILIAFIPAVIVGLLFGTWVKSHLFHPVPVALAFILGGFAILWIEKRNKHPQQPKPAQSAAAFPVTSSTGVASVDDITPALALKLGLVQCLALIPGTSRSGATIMGGLVLGFSRKAAAEFSFFLGVPTLLGASAYALYNDREYLQADAISLLIMGTLFAAISAWLCIRWLIRYVSQHDFRIFAWYRIAFGCLVLISAYAGWIDWSVN